MRRHEELEDSSYPGRHDRSSLLQDVSAVSRGQVLIADPFTVAPRVFFKQDSADNETRKAHDIL